MSIESRPHIGTWRLNNRKVVKHVPDSLVYVNGDLSIPGCPTCGGRIDLQQYVDQVSVDPSTEGPATASITLHIPRHAGDGFVRDGNFILRPSLEVHIYMRGYFPVKGLTSGISAAETGGVDVSNAVMYPYYLVFHGVITDMNYEYSGGEHRATLSCTDMLHFWQYQRIATSGSVFGARPSNSKVEVTLVGHTLTGMSPFAITYMMFRDVMGAAGGVEFALKQKTTADAMSDDRSQSLYAASILYWNKRFSQADTSLRMYGANGTLYSAFEAAFLANLTDTEALGKKVSNKSQNTQDRNAVKKAADGIGFDKDSLISGAEGSDNDGSLTIDVSELQGFVSDISQWGSVNLFETTYVTKMEIMNTVKQACGYEFYQDVDGDFVFKPPFYNLDTSDSRVYRIEDIDIISFSAAEKEPEATTVKVTGSHWRNLKVPSLDGEWGTRSEYIDYRLVAQFGWRQQTYESSFHQDAGAMFFSAMARFDLFNIGIKSATCTIPIRPELRPGYPVYIVFADCYYYIHSMNHSLSFGGQCTTTLNLVGKRAKFYAPGEPPSDGRKATVEDIHLDNLHLPPLPLEVSELDGEVLPSPRLQGFPNVVMMLDPTKADPYALNPGGVDVSTLTTEEAIKSLIDQVRRGPYGVLQLSPDDDGSATDAQSRSLDGPFVIPTGAGTYTPLPDVSQLLEQAKKYQSAASAGNNMFDASKEGCVELAWLLDKTKTGRGKFYPEEDSSAAYLDLLSSQKATFGTGTLQGYYRYYSSSYPGSDTMQGPQVLVTGTDGKTTVGSTVKVDESMESTATQFVTANSGGNTLREGGQVLAGIPLVKSGSSAKNPQTISTPTHQITTFSIAMMSVTGTETTASTETVPPPSFPKDKLQTDYFTYFIDNFSPEVGDEDRVGDTEKFGCTFDEVAERINDTLGVRPEFPDPDRLFNEVEGDLSDRDERLRNLADECAGECATVACTEIRRLLGLISPVAGARITSRYGARTPPVNKETGEVGSSFHQGLDEAAAEGTPIVSLTSGTVSVTLNPTAKTGYGNVVTVKSTDASGNTVEMVYAHCKDVTVKSGDTVTVGQQIATVGQTGVATGPHLHFEVRVNGEVKDPEEYFESIGASSLTDLAAKWEALWMGEHSVKAGGGTKRKATSKTVTKNHFLPVFPVSDHKGYEVVGTYRYGRGLTLEDIDRLAANADTSGLDYTKVEAFIQTIMKTGADFSKTVGSLDPATKAALASSALSWNEGSWEGDADLIKVLKADGTITENGGINRPSTVREATQKGSVVNAAYGLADLGSNTTRSVCSCKGAEADTLLQAFDTSMFVGLGDNSVQIGDTESVQDWLADQMTAASVDWATTQSVYRGTVLDLASSSPWKTLVASVEQSVANVDTSIAAAQAATDQMAADIAAFGEEE